MRDHTLSHTLKVAFALVLFTMAIHFVASATPTKRVIFSFAGFDGAVPNAGLIFDSAGNLYGTTQLGGVVNQSCPQGCGVVFELSPTPSGVTRTVLYAFCSAANCADGSQPLSGLILDSLGNLYGTTVTGGDGTCQCGTVFQLSPLPDGTWTETPLHKFTGREDGASPYAALKLDATENLYGTTSNGGNNSCTGGCGVVFELVRDSGWSENMIYSFLGGNDGQWPLWQNLTLDSSGNIFGTTYYGGVVTSSCSYGCGTVFELTSIGGVWEKTLIYTFLGGRDGANPASGLVMDATGNLFGTTRSGGKTDGVVFELDPSPSGWTGEIVHTFSGKDGYGPTGTLVFDSAGNLYGTTLNGGNNDNGIGDGVVFQLHPGSDGVWTEGELLFDGRNGKYPAGSVVFDSTGNLYGTTQRGGVHALGVVFEGTP